MLYKELSRAIVAFVLAVAAGVMEFAVVIATPFTWAAIGNAIIFCVSVLLAVMSVRRIIDKATRLDEMTDFMLKGMHVMSDDVARHGEILGEVDDAEAEIQRMSMN